MKQRNRYKFSPALYTLLSFLLTMVVEFYWGASFLYLPTRWHLLLLVGAVLLLLGVTIYLFRIYHHFSRQPIRRKVQWRDLGVILFFYAVILLQNVIIDVMKHGVPSSFRTFDVIRYFSVFYRDHDFVHALFYYGSDVIVAPLLEELTTRGMFATVLLGKKPLWMRYAISSFVFSTLHFYGSFSLWRWVGLFNSSLILQYVYSRRNSLWDSILLHSLANGLLFALFYHLLQQL